MGNFQQAKIKMCALRKKCNLIFFMLKSFMLVATEWHGTLSGHVGAWNPYRRGRISTVDLPVLSSSYHLLLILRTYFSI
jgi:hypothetical protein